MGRGQSVIGRCGSRDRSVRDPPSMTPDLTPRSGPAPPPAARQTSDAAWCPLPPGGRALKPACAVAGRQADRAPPSPLLPDRAPPPPPVTDLAPPDPPLPATRDALTNVGAQIGTRRGAWGEDGRRRDGSAPGVTPGRPGRGPG